MDRRQFLQSSAALAGGLAAYSVFPGSASAANSPRNLDVTTRTLDINGKAATVYHLTSNGKPGLAFEPGETFNVGLRNRLTEPTIIHWHGLIPPFEQDGVGNNPLPMLASNEARAYDFPLDRPGTYWMHAHTLQQQNLLSAPLIVRSREDIAADEQEVVLLLRDFSFTPAGTLLANLSGGKGHASMDHDMMDMGAMNNGTMDHADMDMGTMNMESMDTSTMDLNDIEYDAYLANDRTLDDPDVVKVDKGGRVRLRIINGAASTAFMLSTGALPAELVAVDGQPVTPLNGTTFPLSMGQRIDLIVAIPNRGGAFPILARREGAIQQTGLILATTGATVAKLPSSAQAKAPVLDLSLEQALIASAPLAARPVDREFMVHLAGDMASYKWIMNGAAKLSATPGERIEISMMNMSGMAHPMHLHGHHFQVVAIDGKRFAGALRDTVLVPPMKTVTIAFEAGARGRWPFHCHHLYHMESGMMAYLTVG